MHTSIYMYIYYSVWLQMLGVALFVAVLHVCAAAHLEHRLAMDQQQKFFFSWTPHEEDIEIELEVRIGCILLKRMSK